MEINHEDVVEECEGEVLATVRTLCNYNVSLPFTSFDHLQSECVLNAYKHKTSVFSSWNNIACKI